MSENKYGIDEIKRVIDLVFEVVIFVIVILKDGFQMKDLEAAFDKFKDDAFRLKLKEITENAHVLPNEVTDLKVKEAFEIGKHILGKVKELIAALRK